MRSCAAYAHISGACSSARRRCAGSVCARSASRGSPAASRFSHCTGSEAWRYTTCTGCGKIYNTISNPPAKENVCDVCGKPLMTREDDKAEVIARRIQVYKDQTEPLLAYYRSSGVFHKVDASKAPEAVAEGLSVMLVGK